MQVTKIYVHHNYSEQLFYKIGHNTENRIITNIQNVTKINCEYNNQKIEFIFDEKLNDNDDGYHLIDVMEIFRIKTDDFKRIATIYEVYPEIHASLKNRKKWIILCFFTEKLFIKFDDIEWCNHAKIAEFEFSKLNNHILITDQYFLDKNIEKINYPNHHFALTNSIYQWNTQIGIRWYYEFKQVYDKLNFDYDVCFSVRNYKNSRVQLLKHLVKLKNPKILLQKTDALKNENWEIYNDELSEIPLNSIFGSNDFANITWIPWHKGISLDLFFRLLPKAKMQILDESWAIETDYASQYLSEKTIGYILSGIPFISTHSYPLLILQKALDLNPHPFFDEINSIKSNPQLFSEFLENFMKNFDDNFNKCKIWSDIAHDNLLNKINNENSILNGLLNNEYSFNENIIKTKLM